MVCVCALVCVCDVTGFESSFQSDVKGMASFYLFFDWLPPRWNEKPPDDAIRLYVELTINSGIQFPGGIQFVRSVEPIILKSGTELSKVLDVH